MKNNSINIIFKLSLFVYPLTIIYAIIMGIFVGIDSGWAMPAMSNGTKIYGFDAICSYAMILLISFWFIYVLIFVFQFVCIIYILVKVKKT